MTNPQKKKREEAPAEISEDDHRKRMAELDVEPAAGPIVEPTSEPEPAVTVEPAPAISIGDVFSDLSKLRVNQAYLEAGAVKRQLTRIPVGKPDHQEFVRVRPEPEWRSTYAFIRVKQDNEYYLILPGVFEALPAAEYKFMTLYTLMTGSGALFLWPVPVRGADGKINSWHQSAHDSAAKVMTVWRRIVPNNLVGAYDLIPPHINKPEPEWPDMTVEEVLRLAFARYLIADLNHPLLKKLRGE
jgi:hypothetical protein